MEQEDNEEEEDIESQDENAHPTKKLRSQVMNLDSGEAEIASGLRPIYGTSRNASHSQQAETQSRDEVDGEQDNNFSDGRGTGFDDNDVCP